MSSQAEIQKYLEDIDAQINRLSKRIESLVTRIGEMKLAGTQDHAQVELLATMRVAVKSVTAARQDALKVLDTGENRTHRWPMQER